MARYRLIAALALAFSASTHGAGAEEQRPPSLPAPGSYVAVSDSNGKLIAASYWVGDRTKVSVRTSPGSPEEVAYIDRETLPRRLTAPYLLVVQRFEYDADVQLDRMQIGDTVTVNRRTFSPAFGRQGGTSIFAGERQSGAETIRVKLTGIAERDIGGTRVRQFTYDIHDPKPPTRSRGGTSRVYIADLDFDLDAAAAGRIARVERGEALSSEDFQVLLLIRNAPDTAVANCLTALRGSDAYRAAAGAFRTVADAFTAKSFPASGLDYILEHGYKPISTLMEQTSTKPCFASKAGDSGRAR